MKVGLLLLVILAGVMIGASFVDAHFDPPGAPALQVNVYLVGLSLNEDMDDGLNGYADVTGTYKITHKNHESKEGKTGTIYYDWDTLKGNMRYISKTLLYSHKECSPMNELTLQLTMEEYNSVFSNTPLGSASIKITKPGKYTMNLKKGKVLVEVETVPLILYSDECSTFYEQPSSYASSIVTSSGSDIYDWELANMMKMWIANRTGYGNMVFIFNQCFGGGMIDDLRKKLKGTGDAAFLSASKHNEPSWGLADGYTPADWPEMGKRGFTRPEGYYPKEVGEELERTGKDAPTIKEIAKRAEQQDPRGPYGLGFKETPQYTSIGNGDNVKLGKKADGSEVKSKHAILFVGDADSKRHWNNLDRAYNALKKHGFTDADMIVLAGNGKTKKDGTNVPNYVDGPGTKKALYEAIVNVSKKMNKDEQLVFWVSDHGDRERIEISLLEHIADPVRMPIPPKRTAKKPEQVSWDLDEEFLKAIALDPNNRAYVSILVNATPDVAEYGEELFKNIALYLNDERLELAFIEPIIAYDDEPDLDAFELVYPVDEEVLRKENLIEVGWSEDPGKFVEYTILGLMISTGGINEFEAPAAELPEEKTLFELLKGYVPVYNENADELPGFIKRIAGNERIDLEITLENGSVLEMGVVTEGGKIVEFSRGKPPEPTMRVWTSEDVARKIMESEDPVRTGINAFKMGEIKYSGVGFKRTLTVFGAKVVIKVYRVIEIIGDLFG